MTVLALLVISALGIPARAHADTFADYQIRSDSSFHFPTIGGGTQGPASFDVLGDGRIVGVSTVGDGTGLGTPHVFVETAFGSRTFDVLGTLPLGGGNWFDFGAAFLQVSPDGQRIAIGDNNGRVGVVATASLSGIGTAAVAWHDTTSHFPFLAKWVNDSQLAFTHFGGVSALELGPSANPASPVIRSLVTGIDGASSDLAIDGDGYLYTANGFDFNPGGSTTGEIRRFAPTKWQPGLSGGPAANYGNPADAEDFITYGSGSSLETDGHGNLAIGGADTSDTPQQNQVGIVRIADHQLRQLDPNTQNPDDESNNYTLVHNHVTGEIYVYEPFVILGGVGPIDNTLVHVISPVPFVLGDMDGDGDLDNFDIQPFEQALTDTSAYQLSHLMLPDYRRRGDADQNGVFDNFDIQPFEALLTAGGGATLASVPEPSAIVLLATGLIGLSLRSQLRRRSAGE